MSGSEPGAGGAGRGGPENAGERGLAGEHEVRPSDAGIPNVAPFAAPAGSQTPQEAHGVTPPLKPTTAVADRLQAANSVTSGIAAPDAAAAALARVRRALALLRDPAPAALRSLTAAEGLREGLPAPPLDLLTYAPLATAGLAEGLTAKGGQPAGQGAAPRRSGPGLPAAGSPLGPAAAPRQAGAAAGPAGQPPAGTPHFSLRRQTREGQTPAGSSAAMTPPRARESSPEAGAAGGGIGPATGRMLAAADLPAAGRGEAGSLWPQTPATGLRSPGETTAGPAPGGGQPGETPPGAAGDLLGELAARALAALAPGMSDTAQPAGSRGGAQPDAAAGRAWSQGFAGSRAPLGPAVPGQEQPFAGSAGSSPLPLPSPAVDGGLAGLASLFAGRENTARAPAAGAGAAAAAAGLTGALAATTADDWPSAAQTLAGLVNEALQEQAQRQGVDLS